MTDRELLELAAKAAGIRYDEVKSLPNPTSGIFFGLWLVLDHEPGEWTRRRWNPLTDDGDALRLAVKLAISFHVFHEQRTVVVYGNKTEDCPEGKDILLPISTDANETVRRAIVRAAAEIGRTMP